MIQNTTAYHSGIPCPSMWLKNTIEFLVRTDWDLELPTQYDVVPLGPSRSLKLSRTGSGQ